jgi:beta-mannosidase
MSINIRNLLIVSLLGIIMVSCQQQETQCLTKTINEDWEFKSSTDSNWYPASVPGCVHTDLMNNDIIEDPFFRLNELDVQWVDKLDWEYKTTFYIDNEILDKDNIDIIFKGLDTYANVFLNNNLILEADNMFINWSVSCKQYLVAGNNELRIYFDSPISKGLLKRDLLGYQLPGAENDQSERGGLGDKKVCVFSRKPGYHFGWDWGPRLVTSGIWQDIELNAWNSAQIIDAYIIQEEITNKKASLTINLEIDALKESEVSLTTLLDKELSDARKVKLHIGINTISYQMDIFYPELWWTNGLGNQRIYDFEFQIKDNFDLISNRLVSIGLRTIELVQEPDSVGKSFYFKVNGQPVFMKGANYIPQDVFLDRVSTEDYINLIKSAVDANYNMLRVWGGGIYEKDLFYELCDEAGILVWQDFMFACAMYPGNSEFIDNVKNEAIQNVKRLRNHPCIALWCGDNEILSAWNRWGWKENVLDNQGSPVADTIWKAYDDVFHKLLPDIVEKYDPGRNYWSSSPSSGLGELENGKSGDNHYWGVWWAKEPFSKYEEEIPRFMSEFGFQSFPEFNAVKKYTTEEDWDINSDVMKSHQRSSIGNNTIEEYLLRDYQKPKNFEMFLYVGQLLQARGITIGIEAHRRNMPFCMGSLYWQLNDCWPVASWSGIDYYGNWKALHYSVKDAFKQTIISNTITGDTFNVSVISDGINNTNGSLELVAMDFFGNIIYSTSKDVEILSNKSLVYLHEDLETLKNGYNSSEIVIVTTLSVNDTNIIDQNIFYFEKPKDLELPPSNIELQLQQLDDNTISIVLSTNALAKNVYLQSNVGGHFSDNYFDLLPNQMKDIIFHPDTNINFDNVISDITTISLVDSY